MNLTEEQDAKIKEYAAVTGIDYDEIKRVLDNFMDAAKNLWQELKGLLEPLFKSVENSLSYYDKESWYPPRKIICKSQVLNRKPLLARARSNC